MEIIMNPAAMCYCCHAVLKYDNNDVKETNLGAKIIICPICGNHIIIKDASSREMRPMTYLLKK